MKSNKVVLSTVAGLCTLLLTGTPAAQAVFQDTAGHWAESAIDRMNGYKIVNGYQGQFRPDETITRGEMAVVLDHIMRYQKLADNRFSDLGQDFYTDAILKAGHVGVLLGDEGKVRPNDPILREEAVAMMARAFDVAASDAAISVPDAGSISSWAKGVISAFIQKGYVGGSETFRPQEPITRAETVAILNRMLSGYYPMAGSYTESANGTVVVNTPEVSLKNMTVAGDLILSEGVQDGDVALEDVIVKGRVLIRGGGAHSIHVRGKSVLGTVVMERDGAAVRLAVEGKAKVESVTVGEKASEAIVTGKVSAVAVEGSGKLTAQDARIGKISVTAPDALVALTGKSSVTTVEVADGAKNAEVSVDKTASVKTVQVEAAGADISGAGRVSEVKANANDISVDTKGTNVTAAKGTSGITAGGQKVPAGGSTNSTPSKNESSSSGGSSSGSSGSSSSSHRPSRPKELAIERVESVQNGLVRVTLNRASDTTLTQNQFSIICTGGGKDMTILSVHTTDNRVYDLVTAYYNDNKYQLGITLEGNKLLTYNFESKYDCPAITDVEATRKTNDTAEISYMSDIAGTFYYTLEANKTIYSGVAASRGIAPIEVIADANQEITPADIIQNGKQQEMKYGGNLFTITDLQTDTPYTVYYVAKGTDEKVTPVKSIQIAGKPDEAPPTGNVTIESVSAHRIPDTDFGDEHIYFDIKLSAPTAESLELKNFRIQCPRGDITLGRVDSKDKQNYRVYMAPDYMITDGSFTLTVTFADETKVQKKFFPDLTAPKISIRNSDVVRIDKRKATVDFRTNEAGKMYWTVFKGTDFDAKGTTPKKLQKILDDKNHETHSFDAAGEYRFEIDFSDKATYSETDLYFCFFSEDALNNRPFAFDYVEIPDYVAPPEPEPEPEPEQGKYKITSITGQVEDLQFPLKKGHVLYVILETNESSGTGSILLSYDNVKIKGKGSTISGHKQVSVGTSSEADAYEVTLKDVILKEGDYTFEATIEGEIITKQFHVEAGDKGTVTPVEP